MAAPKVSQIRIDQHKVGLIGLKEAFEDMATSHAGATDEVIGTELLQRMSKKNYIAAHVQEKYRQAFVREFRKFLGQTVKEDDRSKGMEVIVLGAGCNICDGLEHTLMEVLGEMGIAADLEHIRDPEEIARYKVRGTPALLINGAVMSIGKIPSRQQIRNWLAENGLEQNSGGHMEPTVFIKNIPFSEPQELAGLVEYQQGRVVSRTFAQNSALSLTLFAFDQGEGVSTHTAPGDAMVHVLDGEAAVNIDGTEMTVRTGQVVVMPANIPHSVTALKKFKMLLTVVK